MHRYTMILLLFAGLGFGCAQTTSQKQSTDADVSYVFGTVYVQDSGKGVPRVDSMHIRMVDMQQRVFQSQHKHKHGSSACIEMRFVNDAGETLFAQHFDNPLRTSKEVFGDTIRLEQISLSSASFTFRCPLPEETERMEFWYSPSDSTTLLLSTKDL